MLSVVDKFISSWIALFSGQEAFTISRNEIHHYNHSGTLPKAYFWQLAFTVTHFLVKKIIRKVSEILIVYGPI